MPTPPDDPLLDEIPQKALSIKQTNYIKLALLINLTTAWYGLSSILDLRKSIYIEMFTDSDTVVVGLLKFKFMFGMIALIGVIASNYYIKNEPEHPLKYINYFGLLVNLGTIGLCLELIQ